MTCRGIVAVVLVVGLSSEQAFGQGARDGRLIITVADQTSAIIPCATVTVTGQNGAARQVAAAPAQTSPEGVATMSGLPPGRYTVTVAFPGFETSTLADVRIRAGDNRQTVVLAIQKV